MSATAEELVWARAIKHAAQSAGLSPLCDFEYLHHAIIAKDNVAKALNRIRRLEKFRAEHRLNNLSIPEATQILVEFGQIFPKFVLGMAYDNSNTACLVADYKVFDPKSLRTEEDWRVMMGGFYYQFQAANCDLENIRKGLELIADCKGTSWKNFSFEVEKKAAAFYQDAYPIRLNTCVMLDAPKILNIMISLMKVFLSKKMRESIVIATAEEFYGKEEWPAKLVLERLGGETKEEDMHSFVLEKLAIREENERMFSLDME